MGSSKAEGKSKGESPEAGLQLACTQNTVKTGATGAEEVREPGRK